MKYRVTAPMGLTLPAGTVLLNLTAAQLARLATHLKPGKRNDRRELAIAAAFKCGEVLEPAEKVAKAHLAFLEEVAEPAKPIAPKKSGEGPTLNAGGGGSGEAGAESGQQPGA